MENLDPIAHVEPQLLVELGRLTILAGKLETLMNDVARSLAIKEPQKHGFSKVAKASKRQIKANDLPEWSRVDPPELDKWIDKSLTAMDERNDRLHADSFQTMNSDGEYVPVYMSAKNGERMEQTVEDYHSLALKFRALTQQGNGLATALLPFLRDDVPGAYDIRFPEPTVSLDPKPRN